MATEAERGLQRLLGVLSEVGARCSGTAADQSRSFALGFAFKLVYHAASAVTLLRERTAITESSPRFLDRTSACVLARAGWESFLLFHHLFIDVVDDDDRRMRWLRWMIETP